MGELAYSQNNQLREFLRHAEVVQDNYKYHIRGFVDFAERLATDDLSAAVGAYFAHLNQTDYSASTVRCKRQAVKDRLRREMAKPIYSGEQRTFFEYKLRELDRDPKTKCPGGGGVTGATKILSDEDYEKVMHGARSDRQKRFIEFLWTTGARVSEMCDVTLADCKIADPVVLVRLRGKGNKQQAYKERIVFITRAMFDRIRSVFNGEKYLFETATGRRYNRSYVSNQIGKVTKTVLGRRLSAHKLRHSFATKKIVQTGRYKAVSEYLGHADVKITLSVYSHDVFTPADVLGPEALA